MPLSCNLSRLRRLKCVKSSLDHATLLTLADLQRYGLNADHMNNHAEL